MPCLSPLDTLVRSTSNSHRRARQPLSSTSQYNPVPAQSYHSSEQRRLSPISPLLHSHFRDSSTTTSNSNDDSSYLDRSTVSGDDSAEYHYHCDDESIYSNPSAHFSNHFDEVGLRQLRPAMSNAHEPSGGQTFGSGSERVVPTVVISPAEYDGWKAERPPTVNFSRPVRQIPSPLDEQKRRVLERNSRRSPTPQTSPSSSSLQSSRSITAKPRPPDSYTRVSAPNSPFQTSESSSSSLPNGSPLGTAFNPVHPPVRGIAPRSVITESSPSTGTPMTVHSSYSSHQLDGVTPPSTPGVLPSVSAQAQRQQRQTDIPPISPSPQSQSPTPQDYVQLGIQHHEANRLKDSASYFEKSAKELGGCGVGMLMWGLTLRHGWGCEKDEKQGFKWLRKAAESAVADLETARGGIDISPQAVQTELVIAIYEVAQCFFQGWGVSRDQKMAVSYYEVAARLGDADAQHDLAFCLANGKGCKKDRKESAKWYRAAVAQGASDVGLAWIYKEKFQ